MSLIIFCILVASSFAQAWIVPERDDMNQLFVRESLWELGAGASNPWSEPQVWNAFAYWRRNSEHWSLQTSVSHGQMDSIYTTNSWEIEVLLRSTRLALLARAQGTHLTVPGIANPWSPQALLLLGIQPTNPWLTQFGFSAEDSCVRGIISIQWRLGDSYRMSMQLAGLKPQPSSLELRQSLQLDPQSWATLAWTYPTQIVSASFTWSISTLSLQAGELWAPALPPSPNASIRIQRRDRD